MTIYLSIQSSNMQQWRFSFVEQRDMMIAFSIKINQRILLIRKNVSFKSVIDLIRYIFGFDTILRRLIFKFNIMYIC